MAPLYPPSYAWIMDNELTLDELARLEAERKLRPARGRPRDRLGPRGPNRGGHRCGPGGRSERCSCLSACPPYRRMGGPDRCRSSCRARSSFARRAGALLDIEPAVLERIPELRHIAKRGQAWLIACVAREFETRITPDEQGRYRSPRAVLQAMRNSADASRVRSSTLSNALRNRVEALVLLDEVELSHARELKQMEFDRANAATRVQIGAVMKNVSAFAARRGTPAQRTQPHSDSRSSSSTAWFSRGNSAQRSKTFRRKRSMTR